MTWKIAKCPVCDWEIKEGGVGVKVGGKDVFVCCDDCAEKLKGAPDKYSEKGK